MLGYISNLWNTFLFLVLKLIFKIITTLSFKISKHEANNDDHNYHDDDDDDDDTHEVTLSDSNPAR